MPFLLSFLPHTHLQPLARTFPSQDPLIALFIPLLLLRHQHALHKVSMDGHGGCPVGRRMLYTCLCPVSGSTRQLLLPRLPGL